MTNDVVTQSFFVSFLLILHINIYTANRCLLLSIALMLMIVVLQIVFAYKNSNRMTYNTSNNNKTQQNKHSLLEPLRVMFIFREQSTNWKFDYFVLFSKNVSIRKWLASLLMLVDSQRGCLTITASSGWWIVLGWPFFMIAVLVHDVLVGCIYFNQQGQKIQ